jgi:hypothetical protein
LDCLTRSEAIFLNECVGMTWELSTVRLYQLFALSYLGRIAEMARRVSEHLAEAVDRGNLYAAASLRLGLLNSAWLVSDDLEGAQRVATEALQHWSHQGFQAQHWFELTARTQIALYAGHGQAAYSHMTERWPALKSSLIMRVQIVRIEALTYLSRCALAASLDKTAPREDLLRQTEKHARLLERERTPVSAPLALLLRAGISAVRGDPAAAMTLLDRAAGESEAADMALLATVARWRRGELLGGDEGASSVREADCWMTEQGIRNPARFAEVIAPGFSHRW